MYIEKTLENETMTEILCRRLIVVGIFLLLHLLLVFSIEFVNVLIKYF